MLDMTELYVLYEMDRYAELLATETVPNVTFTQKLVEASTKPYRQSKLRTLQLRAKFSNV